LPEVVDVVRVSRTCAIPLAELEWRFSGSGGPGGQHANTSNTRVEVVFDVEHSRSLDSGQRSRLLERLGPVVRVVASDERSQARNRQLAVERLRTKLAGALHVPTARRPTRPSAGAHQRRLDAKRRRAALKRQRSARPQEE
jgi:ribosome-associated protein